MHFALMATIDYLGRRMSVSSVLPIGGATLCYGSADGGRTVLGLDDLVNPRHRNAVQDAAHALNLKEHIVYADASGTWSLVDGVPCAWCGGEVGWGGEGGVGVMSAGAGVGRCGPVCFLKTHTAQPSTCLPCSLSPRLLAHPRCHGSLRTHALLC